MSNQPPIEEVKKRYEMKWIQIPGVEGVGITEKNGEEVIVLYISEKTKEIETQIPPSFDGYRVTLEVTGTFHAQ